MSSLPLEILHLILQKFHNNAPSLKRCTLVNRSWCHEAQSVLFSTHSVHIDFPDNVNTATAWTSPRSLDEFIQLINKSPHLKSLIRAVKLYLVDAAQDSNYHGWSMVGLLSSLINAGLPGLETLVLWDPDRISWKDVSLPQLDSVDPELEMTFSSVTRLDFRSMPINAPNLRSLQCFLCSFPQLQDLALGHFLLIHNQETDSNSMPAPITLHLWRLDIGINDDGVNSNAFTKWLSQTYTVDTLECLTLRGKWNTPQVAKFVGTLSKPWSLQIVGGTMYRISSITLTEITIEKLFIGNQDKIFTSVLVEMCKPFNAPALLTLRWSLDCWNGQHPHFVELEVDDSIPLIPRKQFPMLQRVEVVFPRKTTKAVWNCWALKNIFKGYEDLEFMFTIPVFDWPMPSDET